MNESDERVRDLVRRAIGPPADPELKRDLWPRMRARLDAPPVRVPWWDWALAAAVVVCLLAFPAAIPAVLYQL
jgi:hypothetical protein